MNTKVTNLVITGNFGCANTGTIEKCIVASLTALDISKSAVSVLQTNDTTLDISIVIDTPVTENSNV